MRALIELGQIAITLITSGVVALLVGPAYLAVALLVMATCCVLLYDAARRVVVQEPLDLQELALIAGSSFVFGMIWPSIPLVLTWKRFGDAGE